MIITELRCIHICTIVHVHNYSDAVIIMYNYIHLCYPSHYTTCTSLNKHIYWKGIFVQQPEAFSIANRPAFVFNYTRTLITQSLFMHATTIIQPASKPASYPS